MILFLLLFLLLLLLQIVAVGGSNANGIADDVSNKCLGNRVFASTPSMKEGKQWQVLWMEILSFFSASQNLQCSKNSKPYPPPYSGYSQLVFTISTNHHSSLTSAFQSYYTTGEKRKEKGKVICYSVSVSYSPFLRNRIPQIFLSGLVYIFYWSF